MVPTSAIAACRRLLIAGLAFGVPGAATLAQELEPRAYRTIPIGLNFALLNFGYSSGNVITDVTSPVQDLDLSLRTTSIAYLRSLGLAGRSASVSVVVPHGYISGSGTLAGERVTGSRSGPADL